MSRRPVGPFTPEVVAGKARPQPSYTRPMSEFKYTGVVTGYDDELDKHCGELEQALADVGGTALTIERGELRDLDVTFRIHADGAEQARRVGNTVMGTAFGRSWGGTSGFVYEA